MRSALGEQAPSGAICYKVHYKAMALDHHVVEYDVDKAKRASLGGSCVPADGTYHARSQDMPRFIP